jgi:hypothetical protein
LWTFRELSTAKAKQVPKSTLLWTLKKLSTGKVYILVDFGAGLKYGNYTLLQKLIFQKLTHFQIPQKIGSSQK